MPKPILQADAQELERRRNFARSLEHPAFVEQSANSGMVKVVRPVSPPAATHIADDFSTPLIDPRLPHAQNDANDDSSGNKPSPKRPRAEEPNLTVRLPEYVQQAVRMRAVTEKTTVRLVILRALKGAGFVVNEDDMTDDRGIVAKMRGRTR
jgi:hypothetical protein